MSDVRDSFKGKPHVDASVEGRTKARNVDMGAEIVLELDNLQIVVLQQV